MEKRCSGNGKSARAQMSTYRLSRRVVLGGWIEDLEELEKIKGGGHKWGEIGKNKDEVLGVMMGLIEEL